jgi:heterogeneous nuclear ribonucleoprotein R
MFQIRLMKDKDSGESKGFAFVAFKSKEVARKAIEELHSKDYKVLMIWCKVLVICRYFLLIFFF